MLYAWGVELAKDVAYPLKSPSSQATRTHPWKARSYETMLSMGRKKSLIISHTQLRTLPISIPISTKEKKFEREKKWRPTPGARKSKQRKKNWSKVKRKQVS